jgi:hypothetical protein
MVAGNDAIDAINYLQNNELHTIHKGGYEQIFQRLEQLRDESASWVPETATLALLLESESRLRRWSRVVPESWTVAGGGTEQINPQQELGFSPKCGPS